MKKTITISAIIALTFFATTKTSAQNNLQFNKVVYIQCNGETTGSVDTTITVLADKVWKIESVISSAYAVKLDGKSIYTPSYAKTTPFWLPVGSYTFSSEAGSNIPSFSISAIEFNVVP